MWSMYDIVAHQDCLHYQQLRVTGTSQCSAIYTQRGS